MSHAIFFISDGTGITAETLGRSLLTQFPKINFSYTTIPYVNNLARAEQALGKIRASTSDERPIIFATLIDAKVSSFLQKSNALFINFLQPHLQTLENEFGHEAEKTVGKFHSTKNNGSYKLRIDAINFAILNDDGANTKQYQNADIILTGVSRSGKTPTSLYLALQYGIFVANYPLTTEDFAKNELPQILQQYRNKLLGLVIDPLRLSQIRQERLPNSQYASLKQCEQEINQAKTLFQKAQINYLDATNRSIEELAADILTSTDWVRHR
ncbi:MAG: kinase/pyrophosphorylase [Gammaproteobacteria bacterium]|nr:kinase/pyrophosphorylase [Gammaproteobacteria bacterium]